MNIDNRRFRFGVLGENAASGKQLLEEARRAEDLGYATFLLRDHFVADPFGPQLAPLPALTAVAAATSRLRIGTLVLDNDYRHPVILAKEAATLDHLSGGRLELGIGAGWLRDEYDRAGMTFDPPGVRVGRLEEALRLLKGLLSGSAVTVVGTHYSVSGLDTFPEPAQRPRPPILVGAGSRRMLGIAGREADIVGILPKALPGGTISDDLAERTPETVASKVEWVRAAAGARFDEVELSMVISPDITDDHYGAAERYAAEHGWGIAAADRVLEMPSTFVGPVARIVDDMLARREHYGFSYYVVSDQDLDAFGPVVERLAGR
jgi:probable F420-dependent oxidoreductase